MANWFSYLVIGWLGFGLGMGFTAYMLMASRIIQDIHIEQNIKSPQKMLAEWVQQ